jgi:hypothetical protein
MTDRLKQDAFPITWIANKQLSVIWIQSQRPYRESRAMKIKENFDPQRLDPIRVTLPNGKGEYHIIDGQHRKSAVEMLWGSEEKVPCIILDANDPAEAAKIFDGINGLRFGVDPIAKFKVRVTAKEEVESAVNRIVEHRGYKIAPGRSVEMRSARVISAVGALINVYTVNGPKVLDSVLQLISATWPSDPYATSSTIIKAYGQLLSEFGNRVDWGRLKEVTAKKWTPGSLLTSTKETHHTFGGSITEACLRVMLANYNRGLPENKRLIRGNSRHEKP